MPSFDTIRTSLRRVVSALSLLPPAFFVWRFVREWTPALSIRNARQRRAERARGAPPVPPPGLLYSVIGSRDVQGFIESGEMSARSIADALRRAGRPVETLTAVLDMGCGCGRVLRHWSRVPGPAFHGTDYNPVGVRWVQRFLPFVTAGVNELQPPLPYEPESFDAVYSISVLTHLPERMQRPWMEEFWRILRPGGLLVITLQGHGFLSRLTPAEAKRFEAGEVVVIDDQFAGTNMCSIYHPDEYVRGPFSAGFTILERTPHIDTYPYQDQWVMRKTAQVPLQGTPRPLTHRPLLE